MKASILSLCLMSSLSFAEIVSFGVGVVQGEGVTSREVQIQNLIGQALEQKVVKGGLLGSDSKAFAKATQQSLRDIAIALEAMNFNVVQISNEDESTQSKLVLQKLKANSAWKGLQVSPRELSKELRRKLLARKFIQFREQNSVLPVTDSEIQREFTENHKKYGDLSFAKAKENIKSNLSHSQVESRMKDWYDGLENKYHVKNLISEI